MDERATPAAIKWLQKSRLDTPETKGPLGAPDARSPRWTAALVAALVFFAAADANPSATEPGANGARADANTGGELPGGLSLIEYGLVRGAWAAVCDATDDANSQRSFWGGFYATQAFRVAEALAGPAPSGTVRMSYGYQQGKGRAVRKGERVIWIGNLSDGMQHGRKVLTDTSGNRSAVREALLGLPLEQRRKLLLAGVGWDKETIIPEAKLRWVLRDIGNVSVLIRPGSGKGSKLGFGLNRDEDGLVPDSWLGKFTGVWRAGDRLVNVRLAPALPDDWRRVRNQLLAHARVRILAGMADLAENHPPLRLVAGEPKDWAAEAKRQDANFAGISIAAGNGPRLGHRFVPHIQEYNLTVVLRPVSWDGMSEPLGQARWGDMYPNLALEGRVQATAGDPNVAAALKKLVDHALAPLERLDQAAAAVGSPGALRYKPPPAELNAGDPATAPAGTTPGPVSRPATQAATSRPSGKELADMEWHWLDRPDFTGPLSQRVRVRMEANSWQAIVAKARPDLTWGAGVRSLSDGRWAECGMPNMMWIERGRDGKPIFRLERAYTWRPEGKQKTRVVLLEAVDAPADKAWGEMQKQGPLSLPMRQSLAPTPPASGQAGEYATLLGSDGRGGTVYEIGWPMAGMEAKEGVRTLRIMYVWEDAAGRRRILGEGPMGSIGMPRQPGETAAVLKWEGEPCRPSIWFAVREIGSGGGKPHARSLYHDAVLEPRADLSGDLVRWAPNAYVLAEKGDTLEKIAEVMPWPISCLQAITPEKVIPQMWREEIVRLNPRLAGKTLEAGTRVVMPNMTDAEIAMVRLTEVYWRKNSLQVTFAGRTYYLSKEQEGLPAHLRCAFTVEANPAPARRSEPNAYLLSVERTKVLDALPVRGMVYLADVVGDGKWQVVIGSEGDAIGKGLLAGVPMSLAVDVPEDGGWHGPEWSELTSAHEAKGCAAYAIDKDGKFVLLFKDDWMPARTAYTSAAFEHRDATGKLIGRGEEVRIRHESLPAWGNLYGTGRPVRCRVGVYHRTHIPGTGKPYETREHVLEAYWQCDPSGKWRVVEDGRKIPIGASGEFDPNSLRGLLAATQPATQPAAPGGSRP